MRVLASLLALFGCLATAQAASFDCTAAHSPIEAAICTDPALSRLDEALAQAYAAALAAAPRPILLRAEQRDWITRTRDKATAATLRKTMEERLQTLRKAADAARAARAPVAPDGLAMHCIDLRPPQGETCQVEDSGRIADAPGGPLAWQLVGYHDGDVRSAAGVVVLRVLADGRLEPTVWDDAESAHYNQPGIVATPAGKLLDVGGSLDGTGFISIESLYQFSDGGWREIDVTSWLNALNARLPKGLGIWKGVYPDWTHMTAETDLWRGTDANCCPRGGSVRVTLALKDGQIVLTGMRLSSAPLPEP